MRKYQLLTMIFVLSMVSACTRQQSEWDVVYSAPSMSNDPGIADN